MTGARPTRRLLAPAGLVLLLVGGCSHSPASTLDGRADWSQAALPSSAAMTGPRVDFAAVLGRNGTLPPLVTGAGSDPGQPARAQVWTDPGGHDWASKDLPLPSDHESRASVAVSAGKTTWVAGTEWRAGERVVPFVVTSGDRRSWKSVDLPGAVTVAAVTPQAAVALGTSLLVMGSDAAQKPVAFLTGKDQRLVSLPAAPGGRYFTGFAGVAVAGNTVVAVGGASVPGQTAETVVYRSTDGGSTWSVATGPGSGSATAMGIAVEGGRFVVTGYVWGPQGTAQPAAWSSAAGASWTAESLAGLDWRTAGMQPESGDHVWLGAPVVAGARLIAPIHIVSSLAFAAVARNADGSWSMLGASSNWVLPGIQAMPAADDDGSVFIAQSGRNVGRVGVLSADGSWSDDPVRFGTDDAGSQWSSVLNLGGSPVLLGRRPVVSAGSSGTWTQTGQLSSYVVQGTRVTDRPWDPAETGDLADLAAASDATGATVLLGAQVSGDGPSTKANIVGWIRPSSGASWTPVSGFATPHSEDLLGVYRTGDVWTAVGDDRASFQTTALRQSAVWTSRDGVTWTRASGPFAPASSTGQSFAVGACALPDGSPLVVGYTSDGAQTAPVAWRLVAGKWQRIDSALGQFGKLSSCATNGKTTLVQGTSKDRDTVWRTSDGATFTPSALGARGDSFGPIRVVDGGFAAAGTRGSDGQAGAVVWLSVDAKSWRAVPVPSKRELTGVDLISDHGRLVVAADSTSSPEVWILNNPTKLFRSS